MGRLRVNSCLVVPDRREHPSNVASPMRSKPAGSLRLGREAAEERLRELFAELSELYDAHPQLCRRRGRTRGGSIRAYRSA